MLFIIFESAIRATLLIAAVAVVLRLLRIARASARHAVWAGTVATMLLLPALVVWGPKVRLNVLPENTPRNTVVAVELPVPPQSPPVAPRVRMMAADSAWTWKAYAAGTYLAGLALFLLRLAIGTIRVRRLRRTALLVNGQHTHSSLCAPITVGFFGPVAIFPADWSQWGHAQLDIVLTHEQEHARRRDPLFQWFALLNRAVYWFHPLAWWLERQLSGLAEQACDDAVLSSGHDPEDYSRYLLAMARSVQQSGARVQAIGMAMPGSGLPQRIRTILNNVRPAPISRRQIGSVATLCAVMAGVFSLVSPGHGQSSASRPAFDAFEVATIKPAATEPVGSRYFRMKSAHQFYARNYTLKALVGLAWDLSPPAVSGGPQWTDSDHYDILAEVPNGVRPNRDEQMSMLRKLLIDRFRLTFHRTQKEFAIYALTVAKNGPRLKESTVSPDATPEGPPPLAFILSPGDARLPGRNTTMAELASVLQRASLGRPVVDRTRLSGRFDFDLEWSPDESQFDGIVSRLSSVPDSELKPDLFRAIEQQLGLRLEETKGPVEALIIDRVERPSEN